MPDPSRSTAAAALADAAAALERRAPKVAEEAGILNWRYALLGWLTWHVGKRIVKRKAKATAATLAPSHNEKEE